MLTPASITTRPLRSQTQRLIALWILRVFSPGFARNHFISRSSYCDRDIAEYLGLPPEFDDESSGKILRMLDKLHASLEKTKNKTLPSLARKNFALVTESLKLNATEQSLLEFYACVEAESVLVDTFRVTSRIVSSDPPRFLAKILGLPRKPVAKALSPNGRLMKCGLLKRCNPSEKGGFEIHSEELALRLLHEPCDARKLLKLFCVSPAKPPELGLDDYPHLQESLDLLLPYLKAVRAKRKAGVNVLIHGAPGTGKTQLVRVIGAALGAPVFDLDTSDNFGGPLNAAHRMSVLSLAQTYFHDLPVLLVFDEAEDILTPSLMNRGAAQSHKGWFNQMLETCRQPIFWISNSIDTLDPAFSRRFDFILEVPIPPKSQRVRILRKNAGKLVSSALIEQMADIEHLAPAVVTRAHNVIHSIRRDIPHRGRDAAFTHVVGGILNAQGHPDPTAPSIQVIRPGIYDISHLNTSADLREVASNLRRNPSARLCLYGPPGTGKTSFGHWLANEIGQPLLLKKASDLLSPYLGGTEKLIARTFERARQDGAVLLIDEVDSFLRDRTQTRHSWEVTQINEMLTQIESFPGILIASTNLIDQLDPASMRRFDIKLHFGFLDPANVSRLLVSYCEKLGLPKPSTEDLASAQSLETATPGDFAAVARQHRFQPFRSAQGLIQAVAAESELKSFRSRRIGFQ